MDDRPAFFRAFLHTFYDFDFYRDVIPGGVRGALGYLVRLALLVAVVAVIMVTLYQKNHFRTVVQPEIETNVKPAFEGSPALSWKDGVLTAEGTVPFKTSVEVFEQRLTMAVDTRDDPDTSPLLEEAGLTLILTATHLWTATDKKDTKQVTYGKQFDGMSIEAGEAYRFIRAPVFQEPQLGLTSLLMPVVVVGFVLLFLLGAATVIVASLGLMAVPEGRQFGIAGVCTVAAHAMTPAAAVLVGVGALLLFATRDLKSSPMWLLWAAPLTVAVLFTYLALKACTSDTPRPTRRKDGPSDDDLLPPDSV